MAKKDIRDSIFSINGESRHGACIYSWIEKHGSKYVFWDVEKGRIGNVNISAVLNTPIIFIQRLFVLLPSPCK